MKTSPGNRKNTNKNKNSYKHILYIIIIVVGLCRNSPENNDNDN